MNWIDIIIAAVLFVGAHLDAIVAGVLIVSAGLAHLAAAWGLDWLAAVAPRLHKAAETLAGNWGRAANAARIVQIYRAKGPAAALEEIRRLDQASTPPGPADSGPGFPPPASGILPALALLAVALPLAACQTAVAPADAGAAAAMVADVTGASDELDELIGVDKATRCAVYLAGGDVAAAFGLTDDSRAAAVAAALAGYCGTPPSR